MVPMFKVGERHFAGSSFSAQQLANELKIP